MLASASILAVAAISAPASAQTITPQGSATVPVTTQSADPAAPPQLVAPAAPTRPTSSDEIIVTGSRIQTSGFTAPTPSTIIGQDQILKNAQPNIFNTIAQLPSLQGSTGVATGTFSTSSGQQGLSSFSLRGLGTIRTLTLLDGQRVVGANVTGVPDISMFPQLLIKRVDIVNGGASASYGSDAVGGVVNFITDTRFVGLRGNVQGGITNYGDDKQGLAQLAWGGAFAHDRLHVILSGEYDDEQGVGAGDFGIDLAKSRDWHRATTLVNTGITNNGLPQYLYRDYAQPFQYAKYGLISAGPLQGIAFDANGVPFNFQYGSNGVPQRNNNSGNVTGCFVGFCVGGDLSGAVGSGASLKSALKRADGYSRIGFDFAPDNEIYLTTNIAQVKTSNQPNPGAAKTGLTIQCANPFVPLSIKQQCATAGITSFQFGTSNAELPNIKVHTDRRQYRFVGGLKGKLGSGPSNWRYDAYYEHGLNITDINVDNITLTPRFNAAIQAINLNGQIVCANAAARASGCVPLNLFAGNALPSAATLAYIAPEAGPFQHTKQTQDVASIAFSGEPLKLWAGPLSLAFGAEWRREFYRVNADPYGAGVTTISPNDSDYPADPLLNTVNGSNWYAGNYKNGRGRYTVYEGFAEMNLPLWDNQAIGRANFNAAARRTHYSTSGTIWAWKLGGTWQTPWSGIRFRGVTSRDIRAPNLSELFAAPVTTTVPNFTDPFTNTQVSIIQSTIGNSALRPETARDTELGVVLSRPAWLPGFSVSVDYYHIKLKDVISSLSAQQIVNLCFAGDPTTCGAFNLHNTTGPNFVNVQSFNLASWVTSGLNIEASYQWNRPLGLPGNFTVRALGTHIYKFIVNAGIPNTIPNDQAGVNTGATPDWKWLAIQSYTTDKFSLTAQERWFSDGVFGHQYVVCQTGCPVSTVNNPTIDFNKMKGAFYLDVGGSYNLNRNFTAFFKVDNVFDHDPAPAPQTNTGLDVNPALYDTLGRIYRVGLRFNF
ncbi:TonB-dependent receptor [Sphingomonas ginkgonis]|uniref:TonB-dependent receptor n=2 Tax=Sphingomonas ginkgonis TaxID=2315330 RepID=A0A3R9X9Y0_9SPHN|nr:TonB-dependent receptor [Sphingomonas ginkgonis]